MKDELSEADWTEAWAKELERRADEGQSGA
jgi:hypothetical protein